MCPAEDIETLAMMCFGYARLYEVKGERTLARAWAQQSLHYFAHLAPHWTLNVEQWLAGHPEEGAPIDA